MEFFDRLLYVARRMKSFLLVGQLSAKLKKLDSCRTPDFPVETLLFFSYIFCHFCKLILCNYLLKNENSLVFVHCHFGKTGAWIINGEILDLIRCGQIRNTQIHNNRTNRKTDKFCPIRSIFYKLSRNSSSFLAL